LRRWPLDELESFDSVAQAKRNLRAAIEKVAGKLGNTRAIYRKWLCASGILNTLTAIELKEKAESELRGDVQSFKPEEAAVLALLRSRLAKEARRPAAKKQRAKAG
jgi:DNA topoisomerase-1